LNCPRKTKSTTYIAYRWPIESLVQGT